MKLEFFCAGQPGTKGSARAFIAGGKAVITNDAGEKAKAWASIVGDAAEEAMAGRGVWHGSLALSITFYLARPRSHYRAGRQAHLLRLDAPAFAATKPDGDKLERCTWDALTGIVFRDDSQIVKWSGKKRYADDGKTGALIVISTELED